MIEKKLLNKTKIKLIFKQNYGKNIEEIVLITAGSAEIYKIDQKYILKLYQSKYKKDDIEKEINAINHLKNKNFITPTYLCTVNNNYIVDYENRYLVVQEYIEGITKEKFKASKKEIEECGYIHGLLVKNLLDYETKDIEKCDWYDFNKNIEKLNEIISMGKNSIITRDLNKKIELIKNFDYDITNINKISFYVSHGDFSYLQFIYKDKKVKAIIDFIRVKKLPISWEIIRSYSYMDKDCSKGKINIDNLIIYVKAFMKSVKLTKYDLHFMPYIYLCQLLRSTYGYKEYYKNKSDEALEFAHFRTTLCKYLFDNVEEISKRLGELI